MRAQDKALHQLREELYRFGKDNLKWDSPEAKERVATLEVIWSELYRFGVHIGSPLYDRIEKLQIEVIRQMAGLDRKRFSLLVSELREGIITARGEVRLALIRLTSLPTRGFEAIDAWLARHDECREAV